MVTSDQVKLHVQQYFGDAWIFHVLRTGHTWNTMLGAPDLFRVWIDHKEIRIMPIRTNRELAIRLAIWDYEFVGNPDKNRDDMYVRTDEDLAMIPVLLDKFFG